MAAVDAPTTIIDPNATFTEKPVEDRTLSVGTAVCTGEVLDRIREEGRIMEATTPGLFMMPEGDKEYRTFIEMLRDQPPLPDPVFKPGDILPTIEDAGFPLDQMDEYDNEFKKMYADMFSRTSEMGVMGAGDFEARLLALQNELSESKDIDSNGGGPVLTSSGKSSVHSSEHPTTPVHGPVPLFASGSFVHPTEEGSYEAGTEADDERCGSPVDS
jgi:hypothetical protein